MSWTMRWAEQGRWPDWVIRLGIRRLLRQRARSAPEDAANPEFLRSLSEGPVALETGAANEQHYEVPPEYFVQCLGPRMKYSCCYYPMGQETLAEAETAMLRLTCERAELRDGMDILELGCGWGSLSLWMAEHYPGARITAVSNSNSQREFIMQRAGERGLENLRVVTADMNAFETEDRFDRCVSIEMFEHMRNWTELFRRVAEWLKDDGKLFLHVFCHARHAYPYETEGGDNWMGRHFFTGGMMPSFDLPARLAAGFTEEGRWAVNGRHYHKTCMHWLANMDRNRAAIMPVFRNAYGPEHAEIWWNRWRLFHLACAGLFAWRGGREWFVGHYRLAKRPKG